MGKIVISTNVTLDGVVRDPDGQEGFELGSWSTSSWGQGPRRLDRQRNGGSAGRARRYFWAGGALSGSRPGRHRWTSA